jgi:hypothetical protein
MESSQNAEWSLKVKWIKYALGLNIPLGNPLHAFDGKPGFKVLSMLKFRKSSVNRRFCVGTRNSCQQVAFLEFVLLLGFCI